MDPFNVTVPGSRYPISIPATTHLVSPPVDIGATPSTSPASSSSQSQSNPLSRIRRKPVHTYKSPTVNDGFRIDSENDAQHISPTFSSSSHTSSSNSEKPERSTLTLTRQHPSLPLYHPLGRLAQSLPALDRRSLGLPNTVSVDDNEMQLDDRDPRRASSRARKPAAKLRERDHEEAIDQASVNGTPVAAGPLVEREARPAPSPRKRRVGGAGAAGGPKRRRRDPDDGTFPQPAKRTRNPRGVTAAASPLAGVALAAPDAGEDGEPSIPMATPDLQTAVLQAQEARPVRTTRSRAPKKRRDSSGSTSTSLSVSIAVRNQIVGGMDISGEEDPSKSAAMIVETVSVNEMVVEEVGIVRMESREDAQVVATKPPTVFVPEVESSHEQDPAILSTGLQSPPDRHSPAETTVEAPTPDEPLLRPTVPEEKAVENPGDVLPVSEKEEGELSDGPNH